MLIIKGKHAKIVANIKENQFLNILLAEQDKETKYNPKALEITVQNRDQPSDPGTKSSLLPVFCLLGFRNKVLLTSKKPIFLVSPNTLLHCNE